MGLQRTVCEAGSNWHAGGSVKSSGRSDLFSIAVVYEIGAAVSNSLIFEVTLPIALKSSLGI